MNKNEDLARRIRDVFLSGKWIANTNYKELLSEIGVELAVHKAGNLNSIAALTFHINYYLEGLIRVLDGAPLDIRDRYSFDLSPLPSEQDWTRLVARLLHNAELFAAKVQHLPEEKLDAPFTDPRYGTFQMNIEAVIEHSYYHLGQISLLKKIGTLQ
jgi:hypothetical protein